MPDHRYLSIGEVLGLLLEDFPDVTISKIRFLESQGLIEPERTPSGYRKFYDNDVDLLRAILHEQRENFLPLKVIRDRIESGGIQGDNTGARTPPRGIRNVDTATKGSPAGPAAADSRRSNGSVASAAATAAVPEGAGRDSVFRRTDGGPEWADGRAINPGDTRSASSPVTTAVPMIPALPAAPSLPGFGPVSTAIEPTAVPADLVAALIELPIEAATDVVVATIVAPVAEPAPAPAITVPATALPATSLPASDPKRKGSPDRGLPYDRDELCGAAGITHEQLAELESFGLVVGRGAGRDATYAPEALAIATVAARFLANGIDARHLRTWRQAADREAALFEQRIMPLLRQRNPQARQSALATLSELGDLGGLLRTALLDSILRHHYEGG